MGRLARQGQRTNVPGRDGATLFPADGGKFVHRQPLKLRLQNFRAEKANREFAVGQPVGRLAQLLRHCDIHVAVETANELRAELRGVIKDS